jgi:hypothetical protein
MTPYQRNDDGSWTPATPLPPLGWRARLEFWLRHRGHPRLAGILAWVDERTW